MSWPACSQAAAAAPPFTAGDGLDDALAAGDELRVRRHDVDHQALVDPAELDHQLRGQHVQRDLLRGAGGHAGRAGQELGAGMEEDRDLGLGQQWCGRVVGQRHRQRTGRPCGRLRGTGEGRGPDAATAMTTSAGRGSRSRMARARRGIVLRTLERANERVAAAGHEID